ncbi:MAG: hypothetical protein KDD62_06240, partial [Bdellovibrionales bacterium]|nr:hypothetical protein [Bdellovibrionales bacterium]
EQGIAFECWSSRASKQELAELLEPFGIQRDAVRGNLTSSDIERGLEKQSCFLIDPDNIVSKNYETPSFVFFDQLRWELDPGKLTMFSQDLRLIPTATSTVISLARKGRMLLSSMSAVVFGCFIGILFGQIGPVGVLAILVGSLLVGYHLCLRAAGSDPVPS